MAQTIKFVHEDGRFTITHASVDQTKKELSGTRHDMKAMYYVLLDGVFAKEKQRK